MASFAQQYSDDSDSDDSGFDEGLSSDEVLLARISKMRDLMSLGGGSAPTPPAPIVKPTTKPSVVSAPPPTAEAPTPTPTPTPTASAEDDEFLIIDKVHDLSLSGVNAATKTDSPVLQEDKQQEEEEEEEEGYRVTWNRGELGLLFKEGPRGQTIIRRVNKKKSSAEGLHLARAGDVLVAVNGASVRGRDFQELVEQLRLPTFPVTLDFQPLQESSDDDDDEPERTPTVGGTTNANEQRQQQAPTPTFDAPPTYEPPTQPPPTLPPPSYDTYERSAPLPTYDSRQQLASYDAAPRKHSSVSASMRSPQSPKESIFADSQAQAVAAYRQQNRIPSYASMLPPTPTLQQFAAPYSPSLNDTDADDPLGPGEFEVIWRQGTLGCGLKQINGVPTIKSVTPGAAVDVSVQQLAPGDVMVRINGLDPTVIGFRGVVETMQRAPKPVYMIFRRAGWTPGATGVPPGSAPSRHASREIENLRESRVGDDLMMLEQSLSPHQYTVLWADGPLGVQIKNREGNVVVAKFTGTGDPVVCRQIGVGDIFVRIAGREVAPLGVAGVHELLRTVQKPVVIVFESVGGVAAAAPLPAPVSAAPALPADPRESAVPSFRKLRENQQQPQHRSSFSTPELGVYGAAERRALLGAVLGPEDRRSESGAGPSRHHSFAARSDGRTRPGSDRSYASGQDEDAQLPRFSDIEEGRVQTAAVITLPPPPAYLDVFTQSGRALDRAMLLRHQHTEGDSDSASSVSQGQPMTPSGGYPRNGGPALNMSMSPYIQPPPSYDQHLGNGRNNQRVDALRQQYIQAERARNSTQHQPITPRGGREPTYTQMSSYSELDDSGVMAQRRPKVSPSSPLPPPPAYSMAAASPSRHHGSVDLGASTISVLPPPELWIQWSEGPLGITFRRVNGQIVVSRLTGAGYSRGLEQLRPGDWLVSFGSAGVGSYATDELRLSETMELIKSLPKPVDMCFIVR